MKYESLSPILHSRKIVWRAENNKTVVEDKVYLIESEHNNVLILSDSFKNQNAINTDQIDASKVITSDEEEIAIVSYSKSLGESIILAESEFKKQQKCN